MPRRFPLRSQNGKKVEFLHAILYIFFTIEHLICPCNMIPVWMFEWHEAITLKGYYFAYCSMKLLFLWRFSKKMSHISNKTYAIKRYQRYLRNSFKCCDIFFLYFVGLFFFFFLSYFGYKRADDIVLKVLLIIFKVLRNCSKGAVFQTTIHLT